jgi:ribulose-phosphate 3-epimerase
MPRDLPTGLAVAPSILSADFSRLGEQVQAVLDAGAQAIHVDVMDGHFVPPITIGPLIARSIADRVHDAGAILDVHLMVDAPERQVDEFAAAGADLITIHAEATPHVHRTLQAIRAAGCHAGLAICPATPIGVLEEAAEQLDLALCMSVNPGWGGQTFIESSLDKLRRIRLALPERVVVEVDGGIDPGTAGPAVSAGATMLVAGSAVFGAPDPAGAYAAIAGSGAKALTSTAV